MGLFSTLAPLAGIGLSASGVGLPIAMGGSALFGALAANERNNELNARQRRTANASADAISASWARRDGRGFIPQVQYNEESDSGNLMAGSLGGAMQAYGMKNMKSDLFKGGLFGSSEPDYQFGQYGGGGNLFGRASSNPYGVSLMPEGQMNLQEKYGLPTLFGQFRK